MGRGVARAAVRFNLGDPENDGIAPKVLPDQVTRNFYDISTKEGLRQAPQRAHRTPMYMLFLSAS